MYFHYFLIISPWKRAGPFIWTNLNSLYPRMLFAKFGWNWLSGSGEDFFNFVNVFSLSRNSLPLEKGGGLHLKKNLHSLHPRMLCAKLCWNWPSGFGGEDENVKSLQKERDRRTDRQTKDDTWSEKLTWAFSSSELNIWKKNIARLTWHMWSSFIIYLFIDVNPQTFGKNHPEVAAVRKFNEQWPFCCIMSGINTLWHKIPFCIIFCLLFGPDTNFKMLSRSKVLTCNHIFKKLTTTIQQTGTRNR